MQICSLAGILIGIYLALEYGTYIGAKLQLNSEAAPVVGFIIVLLATMVVITLVAYAVRKLFRFVGLGMLDIILGIVVSIVKYAVVMSVLFSAFSRLNKGFDIVEDRTIDESILYNPIKNISTMAFTLFGEIEGYIPEEIKESIKENKDLDNA